MKVVFPAGALQITRTADARSGDAARASTATHFDAVPDATADDCRIKDGLLDLDPARFHLLQFDVDGAGLKVMNFARSLGRRFDVEARVDPVTRHEDELGAPALRTGRPDAGAAAARQHAVAPLRSQQDAQHQLEGQFAGAANTVSLHAEDLVRGYRIDIWDSDDRPLALALPAQRALTS